VKSFIKRKISALFGLGQSFLALVFVSPKLMISAPLRCQLNSGHSLPVFGDPYDLKPASQSEDFGEEAHCGFTHGNGLYGFQFRVFFNKGFFADSAESHDELEIVADSLAA
jgi:hypothetical protein